MSCLVDDVSAKVHALLSVGEVFPETLAVSDTFAAAVTDAYRGLEADGARAMVARAVR